MNHRKKALIAEGGKWRFFDKTRLANSTAPDNLRALLKHLCL
jgi:hypothetical protein